MCAVQVGVRLYAFLLESGQDGGQPHYLCNAHTSLEV